MIIKEINTKNLIKIIIDNPGKLFEVTLIINSSFRATHFIYTADSISFIDEGIDGERKNVMFIEFLQNYENRFWLIDYIV